MNDTMRLEVRDEVDAFVAEVERRLADLTAEERDELVGGLRADLADRLADHDGPESPEQVLGDPATYAAELRTAAGFPPVMAVRRERRRVSVVAGELLDAGGRAWGEIIDKVPGSPRGFLESLQPAWWVLRAWVAWMVLQDMVHLHVDYGLDWLALLVVAVVGSVQLGRGGGVVARIRSHSAARLLLVGLNVLAVCLLPGSVDRARWATAHEVLEQQGYDGSAEYSVGLFYDGVELTNLFPYDADGTPLTGVQLFTQDGRAVAVNDGLIENDGLSIVYPWLSNGTPRFNTFPLPVGPLDDETWERDPDAWTGTVVPRLPDRPFAVAPEVELPVGGPAAAEDSAPAPAR